MIPKHITHSDSTRTAIEATTAWGRQSRQRHSSESVLLPFYVYIYRRLDLATCSEGSVMEIKCYGHAVQMRCRGHKNKYVKYLV